MDKIIELLKGDDPAAAVAILTENSKDQDTIEELREEYHENKRESRDAQIGKIQVDKSVGPEGNKKSVPAVKVPIPFQQKIVNTATAFEVGEPITLTANEDNALADEVIRLWRANRMDTMMQQVIALQKSETQCAVQFYIKELKPTNWLNRMFGVNEKKDIKAKVLDNKTGRMTPYYDAFGDMKFFTWEFTVLDENAKAQKQVFVYDEENLYHLIDDGGFTLDSTKKHGFGKIPIVYFEQDKAEWMACAEMMDRLELSLSKLSASNDYAGHPILLLYGTVTGAPDKNEDGKSFRIPMKKDKDGKWNHGKVEFATYDQAPKAIKLELQYLEKFIYSLTSTPDLSLENLKGIGNISGVAIRLMFLDAIIKAKLNEGKNRNGIERIINIFLAGTITTTGTSLKEASKNTYFTIKFNSILPDDLKSTVDTLAAAVGGGFMSVKTAVEQLDVAEDAEDELAEINKKTETEPGAEE